MTTVKKAADEELRPSEVSALRGLLGALQWASTQSSPHFSASISLLCGSVNGATQSIAEGANKVLRFAKANADASLRFQRLVHDCYLGRRLGRTARPIELGRILHPPSPQEDA